MEVSTQHVGLALGVVVDVARGQILIEGQIPAGSGGLNPKPRHQVLATDLSDETHAQLQEREAIALWLGQVGKLLYRHADWLIRDSDDQ